MSMTRREALEIIFDLLGKLKDDLDHGTDEWHSDPDRELPEEVPGQRPGAREEGLGQRPSDYDGLDPSDAINETFPAAEQGENPQGNLSPATSLAILALATGRSRTKWRRRRGKRKN